MERKWIIVGAAGGLGREIAREIASRKCNLCLLDLPEKREELQENARDLQQRYGITAHALPFDLSETDKHEQVLEECARHMAGHGGLLFAAGVMWDQQELQADPQRAEHHHTLNYTAPMMLLERFAAELELQGHGHIVALGSPAGDRGRRSNYLYGADKAALHTMLEGMRHRFAGRNIHVTTVKPGPTYTPMTAHMEKLPLGAQPAEQARRIVQGMEKRAAVVYTPPIWQLIMVVIRHLPRFIYNRLDL